MAVSVYMRERVGLLRAENRAYPARARGRDRCGAFGPGDCDQREQRGLAGVEEDAGEARELGKIN